MYLFTFFFQTVLDFSLDGNSDPLVLGDMIIFPISTAAIIFITVGVFGKSMYLRLLIECDFNSSLFQVNTQILWPVPHV